MAINFMAIKAMIESIKAIASESDQEGDRKGRLRPGAGAMVNAVVWAIIAMMAVVGPYVVDIISANNTSQVTSEVSKHSSDLSDLVLSTSELRSSVAELRLQTHKSHQENHQFCSDIKEHLINVEEALNVIYSERGASK